jgi:hypothetical protein
MYVCFKLDSQLLKQIQRKNAENTISTLEKSLAEVEASKTNDNPNAAEQEVSEINIS